MSLLLLAGLDTTAHAGADMIIELAKQSGLRKQLRDEPDAIPCVVEKMLRLVSPLPTLCRTTEPVDVSGAEIEPGQRVQLYRHPSNLDPEEVDGPIKLRLDRPNRRHPGFGMGTHGCLGLHLGRLELRGHSLHSLTPGHLDTGFARNDLSDAETE